MNFQFKKHIALFDGIISIACLFFGNFVESTILHSFFNSNSYWANVIGILLALFAFVLIYIVTFSPNRKMARIATWFFSFLLGIFLFI
jgi:hypothetical protein